MGWETTRRDHRRYTYHIGRNTTHDVRDDDFGEKPRPNDFGVGVTPKKQRMLAWDCIPGLLCSILGQCSVLTHFLGSWSAAYWVTSGTLIHAVSFGRYVSRHIDTIGNAGKDAKDTCLEI